MQPVKYDMSQVCDSFLFTCLVSFRIYPTSVSNVRTPSVIRRGGTPRIIQPLYLVQSTGGHENQLGRFACQDALERGAQLPGAVVNGRNDQRNIFDVYLYLGFPDFCTLDL